MYLKPTGETNTFDVFLGEGWTNWSRIRVNDDGTVTPIRGIELSGHFLTHAKNKVSAMFYSDLRSKRRK